MLAPFSYTRPQKLEDASDALSDANAALHAGGTDLLGCLRDEVFSVDTVVSLAGIEGLAGISDGRDGSMVIGAMTTISDVARNEAVRRHFAGLAQAAGEVASPQLRNQGTLGGNLCQKPRCWYYRGDFHCLRKGGDLCYAVQGENQFHCIFGGSGCFIVHPSDTAPALVALQAEVHITGPKGKRRLPVAELIMPPDDDPTRETRLEPGEIISRIRIPAAAKGTYSSYRKIRTRRSWDFAIAGCALALQMEQDEVADCRIVLAAAAPVPWRSTAAEEELRGKVLDDESIRAAAKAAVADATPLSANAYKIPLFEGMLIEELGKARSRAG